MIAFILAASLGVFAANPLSSQLSFSPDGTVMASFCGGPSHIIGSTLPADKNSGDMRFVWPEREFVFAPQISEREKELTVRLLIGSMSKDYGVKTICADSRSKAP